MLKYEDVPTPEPGEKEVLVRVHAASVNSWDYDMLRGARVITRLWGLRKPRNQTLGTDIAGVVEAVGAGVTKLKPGDDVFGEVSRRFISVGWGAFAEYVSAHEDTMILKPAHVTFEEAAAMPQAGALAVGGIRYQGQIEPGQTALMNGAGGGVGTYFVQIAKALGAEVTAVDSAEKLPMLESLGADHLVDYEKEDFARSGIRYDRIIDVAASRSFLACRKALTSDGVYGVIGGSQARFFQTLIVGAGFSLFGKRTLGTVGPKPNEGMDFLLDLMQEGKVRSVIDRTYPLSETAEAFRYFATGRVRGKIVISVRDQSSS